MTDMDTILTAIVKEYAPYDTIDAFGEGFVAHGVTWENPYDGRQDAAGQVAAQAWDRGLEAANRYQRARQGLPY